MKTLIDENFIIDFFENVWGVEIINEIPDEYLLQIIGRYDNYIGGYSNDLFDLKLLGEGKSGYVFEFEKYAVKLIVNKESGITDRKQNDIQALKDLNHLDCIPTLYAVINEELIIMEKINGYTVNDYCSKNGDNFLNIDDNFLDKWYNTLFTIIENGYTPDDLHDDNVMIDAERIRPVIVDLGWFDKHNKKYSSLEEMKRNKGFENSEMWAGYMLNKYIQRNKKLVNV